MRRYVPEVRRRLKKLRHTLLGDFGLPTTAGNQAGSTRCSSIVTPYPVPGITARDISVVVPVYNGFPYVKRCLDSVMEHLPLGVRVVIVDDCSSEERLRQLFDKLASDDSRFTIVRNKANSGYTHSANRGIGAATGDVVLLNSDTEVASGWIDKLWRAAYSRPGVATVTAVSNAAGAFSVPFRGNRPLPVGSSTQEISWLIEGSSDRKLPVAPTGNGFCMYITRHALERVGTFDEEAFPRGYGEENDFAMRATAEGLCHLVDDTTFVYHQRGASFGAERESLMTAGEALLTARHPEYPRLTKKWFEGDSLSASRPLWARAWNRCARDTTSASRHGLLYVIHDAGGGAVHAATDLARHAARHTRVFVLRMGPRSWTFECIGAEESRQLRRIEFGRRWYAQESMGTERASALLDFLDQNPVKLIHVRHLLGAGPELILWLRGLGYPVVYSFHDFMSVCPNIQLVNNRGRHCEGVCNADMDDCGVWSAFFTELPRLKNAFVYQWRARMARSIEASSAFVATSQTSKSLILKYFPSAETKPFPVIPHGRDFSKRFAAVATEHRYRLVTFGEINEKKGGRFISEILRRAQRKALPIELFVFGSVDPRLELRQYGAVLCGPYRRDKIVEKLSGLGAAAAVLPSIAPETFCHTLTEAWAAGLPVFASEFGALGERVNESGAGWTLNPHEFDAGLQTIIDILNNDAAMNRARSRLDQTRMRNVAEMYSDYRRLYDTVVGLQT